MSSSPLTTAERREPRFNRLFSDFELITAILLGIVTVAIAWATFQGALYDSKMAGLYTKGQNLQTEAESLYLEGNQQYIQDVQTWARLVELTIDMGHSDPEISTAADTKFSSLYDNSVDDNLAAAITWSAEQNDANPDEYSSPFDSEAYFDGLFSAWEERKAEAQQAIRDGEEANSLSDRLALNTVLMSISLFLLGVAAVARNKRVQYVLTASALGVFVVGVVLTAMVPYVGL